MAHSCSCCRAAMVPEVSSILPDARSHDVLVSHARTRALAGHGPRVTASAWATYSLHHVRQVAQRGSALDRHVLDQFLDESVTADPAAWSSTWPSGARRLREPSTGQAVSRQRRTSGAADDPKGQP